MPESWKQIPINSGFLAALVTGVAAVVLTVHGVGVWVDNRVDDGVDRRVAPVERQLDRMNGQLERMYTQQAEHVRERRQMVRLMERMEERLDDDGA